MVRKNCTQHNSSKFLKESSVSDLNFNHFLPKLPSTLSRCMSVHPNFLPEAEAELYEGWSQLSICTSPCTVRTNLTERVRDPGLQYVVTGNDENTFSSRSDSKGSFQK